MPQSVAGILVTDPAANAWLSTGRAGRPIHEVLIRYVVGFISHLVVGIARSGVRWGDQSAAGGGSDGDHGASCVEADR